MLRLNCEYQCFLLQQTKNSTGNNHNFTITNPESGNKNEENNLTEKKVSISSSNLMNLSKQDICIKLLEWRKFGTVLKTAAATDSW